MQSTTRIVVTFIASCASSTALLAQRASPTATANQQVRYKAVWEPVSYKQDLTLYSVYFVTPDIGWASGEGGTIIKTTDGGASWTAQLGGAPGSSAKKIEDLRFIDQHTGFAVQVTGVGDHTLMRTTDGENWEATGTVGQHRGDYIFTSPTVGFQSAKNTIWATQDAGRTWKPVMPCKMSVDAGGVTKTAECEMNSFAFPTPDVGYGMGGSPEKGVFIAKTENGGASWSLSMVLPEQWGREGHFFFTDAMHGVMCVESKFFATNDGAKTWTGIAGAECPAKPEVRFADPEVGWTLFQQSWNYTSDGGRHWTGRSTRFPASVNGFSLPRRDRGYAVGDHGMVFRYRIVPVSYAAPNALEAPVVATFASPLDEEVEQLVAQSHTVSSDGGSAGSGSSSTLVSSSSGGGSAASGSGANASGSRSSNTLGKIQAVLDAISAHVPQFLARYKNLNLVFEGARTSAALPGWFETVKQGFASFRSASDKSAAQAALAQMISAADSLRTETRLAFQKPGSPTP